MIYEQFSIPLAKDGTREKLTNKVYEVLSVYRNDFKSVIGEKKARSVLLKSDKDGREYRLNLIILASQLFNEANAGLNLPIIGICPIGDKAKQVDENGTEKQNEIDFNFFKVAIVTSDDKIEKVELPTSLLQGGRRGGTKKAKEGAEKAPSAPKMESGKKMTQNQDGEEYEEALNVFIKSMEQYLVGVFKVKPEQLNNYSVFLRKRLLESVIVFKPVPQPTEKAKE